MDAITRMRHLSRKGLAGGGEVCYNKTKSSREGREDADLGHHSAVLCGGRFCRRAAGRGRLAAVGGRGLPAGGTGAAGAEADDARPAAAAGDADPLCPVRGAGVHGAVSGTGTGSGDSPLRADGGVLRHGALPPGEDGVGRPCHHPPLRLGSQGGGLRRCGICRVRAGAAALRHGPMAGRCPHPGKRCDGLHLTGRVRSAVCPWTADGGGGQRRKHPVAAPAGGIRPAGEDRRHMARWRHGGLRHGGADRRPQRYGGGGHCRHDAGGGGPSVRRIGAALCLSGVPAGAAAPRPAAGAGGGALYGGAAVLYGDGGSDTLGGPGLHHADIPAGGSAAAPGERWAYQPVGGAAGDPAGQSLRCSGGEPAAELRCHAGTGVLLPKAERLFQGAVPGEEAAGAGGGVASWPPISPLRWRPWCSPSR